MIYTCSYGRAGRLPHTITPVGISLYRPHWTLERLVMLPELAPSKHLFMERLGELRYTQEYTQMLHRLNASTIVRLLDAIMTERAPDVALCCFESPGEFCHRHLVAKWLTETTGLEVTEYLGDGTFGHYSWMGLQSKEERQKALEAERHKRMAAKSKRKQPAGMDSLFGGDL